jgi:polysaccharide deacetylase family protein (PEP-CTERM system associated)
MTAEVFKKTLPIRVLTFDIEEWFHILDTNVSRNETYWNHYESRIHANMERILDLLDRHQQRATFFCLGWIARKYPEVVRAIDKKGFEIGSHSDMHQLVYELGPDGFKSDLEKSLGALQECIGKKTTLFRAPGFSIGKKTPWAFDILASCGIETDCSVFPAHHGHGGFKEYGHATPSIISVNGAEIKEFPINLFSLWGKAVIFSGGGYFRLLPYAVLSPLFQRSPYVMTYFHPRDFDASQPLIPGLPWRRRFKSYFGLKGALSKLDRLLGEFTFTDLQSASKNVDWHNAPIVKL